MAITNGYASLSEVKAALRITDSVDDALLETAVESASRLIDQHCGRNFYSTGTAVPRVYAPDDAVTVRVDDIATTAGLVVKTSSNADGVYDTTWPASDYQLEPLNGVSGGMAVPYNRLRAVDGTYFITNGREATVQVTAVWGWSAVPTAIKQAAIIQSSRIFKRLDSPLGVAGFGDLGVMRVSSSLDPDVRMLVSAYVRFPVAVA